jgi:hypothetical protein
MNLTKCFGWWQVGAILRNSEIRVMSPMLTRSLKCTVQEVEHTVESLVNVDLRNSLDDAAVSMILPCMSRVILSHQFSAKLRMKSAAIIGAMATRCCDDFISKSSYQEMLKLLQHALLDVDPGVREVSAKAISEACPLSQDLCATPLVRWILSLVNSDGSSWAEKSGSAQALAGICDRAPLEAVEDVLHQAHVLLIPDSTPHDVVCPSSELNCTANRSGGLQLLAALADNGRNRRLLNRALPFVVGGFASSSESVRDAALNAGAAIIRDVETEHMQETVHVLGKEMMSAHWRSRLGALRLFGSLVQTDLSKVKKQKGLGFPEMELEQRVGIGPMHAYFSALYLLRSEPIQEVAEAATAVWKSTVTNPPRLLRRILPVLMRYIVEDLGSSTGGEQQHQKEARALNCMQELGSKIAEYNGDGAVQHLLPPLLQGIRNESESVRRGCLRGLEIVMAGASKQQLSRYIPYVQPALVDAVCDQAPGVRQSTVSLLRVMKRVEAGLMSVTALLLERWNFSSEYPCGLSLVLSADGLSLYPGLLDFSRRFPCEATAILVLNSSQFLTLEQRIFFSEATLTSVLFSVSRCSFEGKFDDTMDQLIAAGSQFASSMSEASKQLQTYGFLESLISRSKGIQLDGVTAASADSVVLSGVALLGTANAVLLTELCSSYLVSTESVGLDDMLSQVVHEFSRFVWRPHRRLQTSAINLLGRASAMAATQSPLQAAKDLVASMVQSKIYAEQGSPALASVEENGSMPDVSLLCLIPVLVSALSSSSGTDANDMYSPLNIIETRAEAAALYWTLVPLFPQSAVVPKAALQIVGSLIRYLTEEAQLRGRATAHPAWSNRLQLASARGRVLALRTVRHVLGCAAGSSCRILAPQLLSTVLRGLGDSHADVVEASYDAGLRLASFQWLKLESVVNQIVAVLESAKGAAESLSVPGMHALLQLLEQFFQSCPDLLVRLGSCQRRTELADALDRLLAREGCASRSQQLAESLVSLLRSGGNA